jgi:hypothetical protein
MMTRRNPLPPPRYLGAMHCGWTPLAPTSGKSLTPSHRLTDKKAVPPLADPRAIRDTLRRREVRVLSMTSP